MKRASTTLVCKRLLLVLAVIAITMALSPKTFAGTIQAVQGQKALILLNDESATEGDLFFAISPENKKLGILRIQKVGNNKAIAQVVKGRAEKGWSAIPRGAQIKKASVKPVSTIKLAVGGMAGLSLDSQSVTIASTNVAMQGTGYSGVAFADYFVFDTLSARLILGVDTFNVAGTSTNALCINTTACATDITYLNAGALARWTFLPGAAGLWIGAGAYMLYPLGSSSNAVTTDSIVLTYSLVGALGADINISDKMYIPIQAEYGLFPATGDVSTYFIGGRAGLGYRF